MPTLSIRTRRAVALLALVAAGSAVAASPALADAGGRSPDRAEPASSPLARQKLIAREVVTELAEGETGIVRRAFATDVVDHTGSATGGAKALASAARAEARAHPRARAKVYRVVGQGDLVFVHSHLVLDPGTRGYAVADVFRFADGRIVERWGARQAVPATTASGNDMFSTLSSPQRLSPDPAADVNQTLGTMFAVFGKLVGEKDLSAWDLYVQPPYYQHSVNTPNGVEAVKQVWGTLLVDPALRIDFVNSVAEGDLFVSQTNLVGPGLNLHAFDISRVRNGKIVEHWDVLEPLA